MSEDIKAKALDIQSLVEYQSDSVISREVIKKALGTVTFFAFDQGQGSEHSAPLMRRFRSLTVKPKSPFPVKSTQSKPVRLLSCLQMSLTHFRL